MVTLIEHSFILMTAWSAQLSKWDMKNKKVILESLEGNNEDLQAFKEDLGMVIGGGQLPEMVQVVVGMEEMMGVFWFGVDEASVISNWSQDMVQKDLTWLQIITTLMK